MQRRFLPLVALLVGYPGLLSAAPPPPDDLDITVAVERRLAVDEAVPEHRIDVSTEEGFVTLSGSVDSLHAKLAAEYAAENVRGVLGVINQIEVLPPPRSDTAIRGDVIAALAAEPGVDAVEVEVRVEDRVVTLVGQVESFGERYIAEETAAGVAGVTEVVNRLTYEIATDRPDHAIAGDIQDRLRADASIASGLITASVEDGEVTLAGSVRSAGEKTRAERHVWTVPGVRAVDNNLRVEWWRADEMTEQPQPWSDGRMRQAIDNALDASTRVDAHEIATTVRDGVAILMGEVDNLQAKRTAGEIARNVLGVRRVRNRLRVRPPVARDDSAVAQDIRDALRRNPYVRRYDIAVRLDNGKAVLRGQVDTWHMKSQATEAAATVAGVVAIENKLDVDYKPPVKTDREIEEDIESYLWWNPVTDSDAVQVEVRSGVATLSGTVDDWGQVQAAVETAREAGATSVLNNLRVAYEKQAGQRRRKENLCDGAIEPTRDASWGCS